MVLAIIVLGIFLVLTNAAWAFKYWRLRAASVEAYKKLYQQLYSQLHGNNKIWDEYANSLRRQLAEEKQKSDPDFEMAERVTQHTLH